MDDLIYHVGSGHSLFVGVGLFLLAASASISEAKWSRSSSLLWFLIGVIAVAISSVPFSIWQWIVVGAGSMIWLDCLRKSDSRKKTALVFVLAWLFAVAFEIPYHLKPTLEAANAKTMLVVGDSVTAGHGASDSTIKWPELFQSDHGVEVDNQSQPGERCSTALKHIEGHPIDSAVVFLEIGGNDLLGSTSNEKFGTDLDALLNLVCQDGRQVIMFELPLPPFRNQYGAIQRKLAKRYSVKLIPKRIFLSVITADGATIDSVHLTQSGHDQMARVVWECVSDAFE